AWLCLPCLPVAASGARSCTNAALSAPGTCCRNASPSSPRSGRDTAPPAAALHRPAPAVLTSDLAANQSTRRFHHFHNGGTAAEIAVRTPPANRPPLAASAVPRPSGHTPLQSAWS